MSDSQISIDPNLTHADQLVLQYLFKDTPDHDLSSSPNDDEDQQEEC